MKKAKTPLYDLVRKVFSLAKEANDRQMTAEEVIAAHQARALSRRQFLENTGKTLAMGGIAAYLSACSKEDSLISGTELETQALLGNDERANRHNKNTRIAIVGGGIAGLNALHTFQKANINATVYEASNRTSGRIFSVQNAMGPNTWAEFGAEFIDTEHKEMHALAHELGLELIDTQAASELRLTKEAFYFDGRHHSLAELIEEFRKFSGKIQADIDSLPEEISYQSSTPSARKFDKISLSQYLTNIGAKGWIKRLIEVAYEAEYGLSPNVQSSLNLLTLIDTSTEHGEFKIFGDSDERYKVKGGNMRIPDGLAAKYKEHIKLNHKLTAIKQQGRGYQLSFEGCDHIEADYVILALPFTLLRKVRMDVPMPRIKRQVIDKLNYATTTKLMIGFNNHHWRSLGYAGYTFTSEIQTGWDNAQLQTPDKQAAGFTILLGGPAGIALQEGTPESQKNTWLPRIEEVYKGVTQQHNGKVARMSWPSYPFNLGCYVCYTVGQWTTLSGAENLPIGNIHFAGEHLVSSGQGFMDGAALTGREAAEAILEKIQV